MTLQGMRILLSLTSDAVASLNGLYMQKCELDHDGARCCARLFCNIMKGILLMHGNKLICCPFGTYN